MKYLIWSNEHRGWWKPTRHGYTTATHKAGQFSEEEATKIVTEANRYCGVAAAPTDAALIARIETAIVANDVAYKDMILQQVLVALALPDGAAQASQARIEALEAALREVRDNADNGEWTLPSTFGNRARAALVGELASSGVAQAAIPCMLRECLQSIADMSDQEPREPDDADWRFRCLSAIEVARRVAALPSCGGVAQAATQVEEIMMPAPSRDQIALDLEYPDR